MCGDVSFNNESYFIEGGDWFKADGAYVAELNEQLRQVSCVAPEDLGLHGWISGEEEGYNIGHAGPRFTVLDRHLVRIVSEPGGIEFCDLLKQSATEARLIHVKRAAGAELRALFAQGCVSAELYAYDHEFWEKVFAAQLDGSDSFGERDTAALSAMRWIPLAQTWIVFAIADDTPGHVSTLGSTPTVVGTLNGTLSLFSKVDVFRRIRAIRELGMQVAVTRLKPYPGGRTQRRV